MSRTGKEVGTAGLTATGIGAVSISNIDESTIVGVTQGIVVIPLREIVSRVIPGTE